jgi:hypothetical protein
MGFWQTIFRASNQALHKPHDDVPVVAFSVASQSQVHREGEVAQRTLEKDRGAGYQNPTVGQI